MARLRLFANLRETAGTARIEIPAGTVGELIDTANVKFGPEFERGVESARVWLNGEEAVRDDMVHDSDEVVLLPPVSGGSQPATLAAADLLGFVPVGVAIIAVFANTQGQETWAAALVAIAAMWALDLGSAFESRGRTFSPLAVVLAAAAGSLFAHILGGAGYGASVGIAVAVALGWSAAFAVYRQVETFAPTALVTLLVALGTASLVLSRSGSAADERAIDVFLVATVVGVGLGALVARIPAMPFLDPFSVTALGAVLASVGAAVYWELEVVAYLLVGLGLAVALVAGQGLAAMLRTGRVALSERSPGLLASLDGVILAAAVYYPLTKLIL